MKKNNKKFAWKVVHHLSNGEFKGKLTSAVRSYGYGGSGVEYQLNKWTNPHTASHQFLFVFDTRKQARHFKNEYHSEEYQIFKCEIKNPTIQRIGKFKELFDAVDRTRDRRNWPKGTTFVDSVKLIKKA